MYLGLRGFTDPDDAVESWATGKLDWLVLSQRTFEKRAGDLGRYEKSLEVPKLPETSSGYVLLHRLPTSAQR
jgi:hypothetical protein